MGIGCFCSLLDSFQWKSLCILVSSSHLLLSLRQFAKTTTLCIICDNIQRSYWLIDWLYGVKQRFQQCFSYIATASCSQVPNSTDWAIGLARDINFELGIYIYYHKAIGDKGRKFINIFLTIIIPRFRLKIFTYYEALDSRPLIPACGALVTQTICGLMMIIGTGFFSSTGRRPVSLCHGLLSVVCTSVHPSVH